ncbi:MAG: acyl-CoA dehydrogenase family protein [Solirubrobacteraceae bacterium]
MAATEQRSAATDPRLRAPNQPPPFGDLNLFETNRPLAEALESQGAGWAAERARAVGEIAGRASTLEAGRLANENLPVLRAFDRYGNRIDEVEFHPAWHEMLGIATTHGLHALPWAEPQPGAHAARAAMFMTLSQAEGGHGCPISMTHAIVPAMRVQPEVAAEWEPLITAYAYDGSNRPAGEKPGALAGMAMTEKQGGSDVRANLTTATPLNGGGAGAEYRLDGHKWFCSAPMCDVFLTLAQADGGLSCFAVPRWTPDGERNGIRLLRLKDKLGNHSNASSEIEYEAAWSRMVGEPGRGVATIIEMVGHTRLDCTIGAAAGMRIAVAQAIHHASHRAAFGRTLIDQPLMRNVLADLAIESEAATLLAMRLARAYDEAPADPEQELFKRLATPVAKYWTTKRCPPHAAEAIEVLGGNGYVEDSAMPRLYREAPVNAIWEGSGNVIALDVLRALSRSPETLEAFFAEVDSARGAEPRLDAHVAALRTALADIDAVEPRARRVVELMALALQGSLVVRHSPPAVADAFCAARLGGDAGLLFGTLPATTDFEAIVARHAPV